MERKNSWWIYSSTVMEKKPGLAFWQGAEFSLSYRGKFS
jgi:hypothetical protein